MSITEAVSFSNKKLVLVNSLLHSYRLGKEVHVLIYVKASRLLFKKI